MKVVISLAVLAPIALSLAQEQAPVSYDGAKVFRAVIDDDVESANQTVSSLKLSIWTGRVNPNRFIDVVVPQNSLATFEAQTGNWTKTVMHEDLGASIRAEFDFSDNPESVKVGLDYFKTYHGYEEHLKFLSELQAQYPDNSEVVVAGPSNEGRNITGIHLFGSSGKGKKPATIWHGQTHAREWVAGMTVEYLAWRILSDYGADDEVRGFLDENDFIIFPLVNPDGFVYSLTTDRLWRKNRGIYEGDECAGVDLNRNWNVYWDVPGGSSSDPCSLTYKGRKPEDQAEIKSHASFMRKVAEQPAGIRSFVDWHSYALLLLSPNAWSCEEVAANDEAHQRVGRAFSTAVRYVAGTTYTTGAACPLLYKFTGSSADYAYVVAKAQYSFTAEIRDAGPHGFVLPPEQIIPSGRETWEGVKAMLKAM